jgi:hypothetical protein
MKFLLPAALVVAVIAITLATSKGLFNHPQQASLFPAVTKTTDLGQLTQLTQQPAPVAVTFRCPTDKMARLHVLSPNGGETYQDQQQVKVLWESCNYSSPVSIFLAYMNPSNPNNISNWISLGAQVANTGSQLVTLDGAGVNNTNSISAFGTHYKIFVTNGSPYSTTPGDKLRQFIYYQIFEYLYDTSKCCAEPCFPESNIFRCSCNK